jgi:hypothetical protein
MVVRRFVIAAIAVVAFSLAGANAASAQTGVATLTDELLIACSGGTFLNGRLECSRVETGPDSVRVRARCTTATTGRVTWTASGLASGLALGTFGPYPGTFIEEGAAEFTNGVLTNLEVTFHIDSTLADVDGRKFIEAPMGTGSCEDDVLSFSSHVYGFVPYEAIIKPATGGAFADEGVVQLAVSGVTTANPLVAEVEATIGYVSEYFRSDLALARPLLPDAKEQCKDQGFLIFGFENQGDCVSFVTTNRENEPGQNVAGVT